MSTSTTFDRHMARITAGEDVSSDDIRELADTPDILPLGMLADALRRRVHGTRATYLRVATCPFDQSFASAVPPAAREIQITGAPETAAVAITAIANAKAVAGERTVSAFSWHVVERLSASDGDALTRLLAQFRQAGLDAIAELPVDSVGDPPAALQRLMAAGFDQIRLTIEKAPAADRTDVLLEAARLQSRFGCIQALNPLPTIVNAFRPTTGYEDVKMVAMARLAAPNIATIQVDWMRYGPKLAQVALTFGADDIYGVSASDEASEGRRRAPVQEIRRNIEAAGFDPAERDGRFAAS